MNIINNLTKLPSDKLNVYIRSILAFIKGGHNITNKIKISEITNINLFKKTYNSISALKVFLLELYANIKINKDSQYLKEIQLIFLYFNILKYELKNNTKEINTSLLKKEIYTNKEL